MSLHNKLKIAIAFTSIILLSEFIGGIITNSLALISDSGHVFADVFSLVLSWGALRISLLPPTKSKSYGYHRAEILAALANGLSLLGISILIFYEAFKRILHPEPIESLQMLIIATVGLVVNLFVAFLLKGEHSHNLNVKSAFFHVLGDAISSLGVIIGGIIMLLTNWYLLDAILSFIIGGIIVFGAIKITEEAIHILLEGTPRNLNVEQIKSSIKSIEYVKGVHDLHIWSLCSDCLSLSAHILISEQSTDSTKQILSNINAMLIEKYRIVHTTLQLESIECNTDEIEHHNYNHLHEHIHKHSHKH